MIHDSEIMDHVLVQIILCPGDGARNVLVSGRSCAAQRTHDLCHHRLRTDAI